MQWAEWKTWGASIMNNPASVASVAPSGPSLVSAMAETAFRGLDKSFLKVVELGPGLGTVTNGLLEHIKPNQLMTLETNHRFVKTMNERHSDVTTHAVDAQFLHLLLEQLNAGKVDVIVSSLGLRAMNKDVVQRILCSVEQSLVPQGRFVQYTYGQRAPLLSDSGSGWKQYAKKRVLLNVPPATVYGYEKKL